MRILTGLSAMPALALLLTSCTTSPSPRPARTMVAVPYQDAKFVPVSPRLAEGPRMAVLWGDPSSGPSAVLLEMQRGSVPFHVHTADYHLVVLEGTMKHWLEGQDEASAPLLGPGSYWFQPGGQPHADGCLSDRCVMHIVWSGPRDARLADSPKQ
jgi:mannose-6-phosphate isomerase-like protein (cupin superfamily)